MPTCPRGTTLAAVHSSRLAAGLRGPKGWLRPHEPDAVLAFRLLPEGLEVRVVQIGAAEEARGRELAALLEPRLEPSWPSSWPGRCTAPLLPLLDSDPDLLREPAPPLGELLARHEPGDSVTPEEAWPSTARRQLGPTPAGCCGTPPTTSASTPPAWPTRSCVRC